MLDAIMGYGALALYVVLLVLLMVRLVKTKRSWLKKTLTLTLFLYLFAGLFILGYSILAMPSEPMEIQGAVLEPESLAAYAYSGDQTEALEKHGNPDGFLLLELDGKRHETWQYITEGLELTFVDGALSDASENPGLQTLKPPETLLNPGDFTTGMTPGTALAQAGLRSFIIEDTRSQWGFNGRLYYGEGLVMGFEGNRLLYMETLLQDNQKGVE